MKTLIAVFALLITLNSCNEKNTSNSTNTGSDNLNFNLTLVCKDCAPGKLYLSRALEGALVKIDSFELSQGDSAFFQNELPSPELCYLSVPGLKEDIPLFIEDGKIKVRLKANTPADVIVEGSRLHTEYASLLEKLNMFDENMKRLEEAYDIAVLNNNQEKMEGIDQMYFSQRDQKNEFVQNYVSNHPGSPVSAYSVVRFISWELDAEKLKTYADSFRIFIPESKYVHYLQSRFEKLDAIKPGRIAPDFTLLNTEGAEVSLSSFRGKYVLLDFWASWCVPCREKNPELVQLYKDYADKGFTILGVSLDEDRDAWLGAIEADGLVWDQVSELKGWKSETGSVYAVNSIPRSLLIDPDGVIMVDDPAGEDLRVMLDDYL